MPFVLAWAGAVACGIWTMVDYEFTATPTVESPSQWPAESTLPQPKHRPALLMFVHPHCPCSRASLEELADFVDRHPNRLDAFLIFVLPKGLPPNWADSSLWHTAASMSNLHLVRDLGAREAARFHASVSGESLLYDSAGKLVFHGGLTPSRGHRGESPARFLLEAAVRGTETQRTLPVFGCPLHDRCTLPQRTATPPNLTSASPELLQ